MALYQKYRPSTLNELVGQEFVRVTLQSALKKEQAAHAYLFFGSRGTGKTSTARILAKALNCQNPLESGDPCNGCDFCHASDSGSFVDLIEIDGASNRKIEHARALIERITFAPTLGKRKVYIIDEVHMLTKEAFNALLKTIEEPPEHAFFLLATTELNKVPETIRSRCQVFTFHRFTLEQIADRLSEICSKENITTSREALLLIAKKATGGLRDAIGLLEQASASGEVSVEHLQNELGLVSGGQLENFYALLSEKKTGEAIDFVGEISAEGLSLTDFLEQFLGFLREKMIAAVESSSDANVYITLLSSFDEARRALRDAPIPTLPIEIAIVKSTQTSNVSLPSSSMSSEPKESSGWNIFGKKESEKQDVRKGQPVQEKKNLTDSSQAELKSEKNQPASSSGKQEEAEKQEIKEKHPVDATTTLLELSLENVKKNWSDVLSKLKDPMLKVALQQAIVSGVEEKTLVLTFSAESWKSQVENDSRFSELLSALRNTFSSDIELKLTVETTILQPVEKVEKESSKNEETVTPEMIGEIFGVKNKK